MRRVIKRQVPIAKRPPTLFAARVAMREERNPMTKKRVCFFVFSFCDMYEMQSAAMGAQ
jgi:hypothetical protein